MRAVQFRALRDTRPQPLALGWPSIVGALSDHAVRDDKTQGALWSPVDYRPGTTRANGNVSQVFAFVADLDGQPLDAVRDRLVGREWHAYTTHSHRSDKPSWHVVLPLASPVKGSDWRRAWLTIRSWLRAGDEQTCDASRAYFLPQRHPSRDAQVDGGRGLWLDWQELPSVELPPRTTRTHVPGRGIVVNWDDVEEPAELMGLQGRDLVVASLTYLRRLRAA